MLWTMNAWGIYHMYHLYPGYLSRKVSFWLFKIFEIQKGRTFSFNDILHNLSTTLVNIAIRSRVEKRKIKGWRKFKKIAL